MPDRLETTIYAMIASWTRLPPAALKAGDRLLQDLRLDGDDYGMSLVPELERRFGIKPTIAEWESIHTVQDVVDLVRPHAQQREPSHTE
jgi:acyl carrier protein